MMRFVAATAGVVAATADVNAPPSYPQQGYPQQGYQGYGGYGYRQPKVTFAEPYPIIDPNYYSQVLTRYQTCLSTKCAALPSAYSASSVNDCISTVASYTSCVTACAAAEMLETAEDFRDLIGTVIEVGHDQLRTARQYLSGQGDFDVIANRVRIGESCCLPQDYFARWERIMIPVKTKLDPYTPPRPKYPSNYGNQYGEQYGDDGYGQYGRVLEDEKSSTEDENSTEYDDDEDNSVEARRIPGRPRAAEYMMSAPAYLTHCSTSNEKTLKAEAASIPWLQGIHCDPKVTQYLHFLQRNVGDLILTPECNSRAPDDACCPSAQNNPRATEFPSDVCVAYSAQVDGKTRQLTEPLLKPVVASNSYANSCPPDYIPGDKYDDKHDTIISYYRVAQRDLKYWTVTSGLPSDSSTKSYHTKCEYNGGLVAEKPTENGFFAWRQAPVTDEEIDAARICPTDGLLEYCNIDQYASFLQTQLFDHSKCDISELRVLKDDVPASYQTVACLYKIFTLKCDCMEAVLNCYSHANKYSDALSKTIGHAASILCGFILCQRPNIYSLFGEEYAIEHSQLMRELLASTGLMGASGITPAMTVLVSFGLGMIALFATKKAVGMKSQTVKVEDGYSNLI